MCISLLLTETQEKLFRFLKTRLRGNGEELPRYDENGERYTYVLREKSVKGADGKELLAGAADAAVGGMGLYVRDDDGSTTASHVITNTYEGPKGKLKVRKLMKLSKNGDKVTFPAVKFELTRSYTSYADGTPKVVEDTGFAKQVKILSSAEVQAAYEAARGAGGSSGFSGMCLRQSGSLCAERNGLSVHGDGAQGRIPGRL